MKKKYLVVLFSLTGCYNSNTVKGKWVEYNNPENTIVFSDSTATFTIDGEKSTFKYEGDKAITIYSQGEATEIHCIVEDDYEQLQCGQTIYVRENNSTQKDNEVNSSSEKEEDSQKSLDAISKDKQKSLKEITVTNYLNLLNSNTKSIIYISRPDCKYCKIQDPIIKNIYYENPKIPLYYINTNNMSSSDWDDLENSDEFFNSKWGTPTIIVIENGRIIDSFIGIYSKDNIIDLLESNDIL